MAESGIIAKLQSGNALSAEDREAALYLLNSIQKSREDWNYLGDIYFVGGGDSD